jgi:hypothetical protein
LKKEGVCVVAFLTLEKDYPESVAQFEGNIAILKALKKKYHTRKSKISFVFVNAIDRGRKLVRDFGISDMFPSMIAFDGSRSQYSLLRTAFDDSSVSSFLDVFLSGRGRIAYTQEVLLDKKVLEKKPDAKVVDDEL